MSCRRKDDLVRAFANGTAGSEPGLAEHLEGCAACRALEAELATIARRLAPAAGELDDPSFATDVMTLVRMGRAARVPTEAPRPAWWASGRTWFAASALVVAAAVVVLIVLPGGRRGVDADGFRARGGGADDADRWVSIDVFRATAAGYQPVGDVIASRDALAFSYVNRAADRWRFLMIVAVDRRGEIFWYYPAHVDAAADPSGIPILVGGPVQLPEQIAHALEPGPLRVFGLFATTPLTVSAIERVIAADLARAGGLERLERLSLDGIGQDSRLLTVVAAGSDASR